MASRVLRLRLRLRPLLFLLGACSFLACWAEHATEVEDKSGKATMKAMLEQHTALRRLMMKAGDDIDPAVRAKVLAPVTTSTRRSERKCWRWKNRWRRLASR
mmetsp:Transcript_15099/g.52994  ORF Transcript_15099/g.52994 Transcript_15099/m.52994 type:complete len:102 (-) Transcript_15099:307-612(-)